MAKPWDPTIRPAPLGLGSHLAVPLLGPCGWNNSSSEALFRIFTVVGQSKRLSLLGIQPLERPPGSAEGAIETNGDNVAIRLEV